MNRKARPERGGQGPVDPFEGIAALYALGSLPPDEAEAFEAHVAGCAACAGELRSCREVAADVARASAVPPPEALRKRVLERIAAEPAGGAERKAPARPAPADDTQVWKRWGQPVGDPGFRVVRGGEEGWEDTAVPGIRVKPLSVDPVRRYVTMLVRMEPGSSYPPHRHAGAEECYVLQGDLHVGEDVLRGGDYQVASDESKHPAQWTERGCLLLVVSSQEDELLEGI